MHTIHLHIDHPHRSIHLRCVPVHLLNLGDHGSDNILEEGVSRHTEVVTVALFGRPKKSGALGVGKVHFHIGSTCMGVAQVQ